MAAAKKRTFEVVYVPVADLNPAVYNPRRATQKQVEDITNSIKTFGLVDPLVVNSNPERFNIVVGGHLRLRVAKELGFDEVPVHYKHLTEEQERELNLRLNKNTGEWDWDMLASFDMPTLVGVGFTMPELTLNFGLDDGTTDEFDGDDDDDDDDLDEVPYTSVVNVPQYEPTGECPETSELCDRTRAVALEAEIQAATLPDDMRAFLLAAAQRHVVFDYRKIAEAYAHATPEVQQLFERSALVIIDVKDAIRDGYVRFARAVESLRENEEAASGASDEA